MSGPLAGTRVLVTREHPGRLADLLVSRGADVVHVPLIGVTEPVDGGAAFAAAMSSLSDVDWLVVTSIAGADRAGRYAAGHPRLRLAAVGAATAARLAELAGRPVDLVPADQRGVALAAELVDRVRDADARVVLAQAERADPALAEGLRRAGLRCDVVTAYRTELRTPDPAAVAGADAVTFASGSAVSAWVGAFGTTTPPLPPIVVVIGPTTAAVAGHVGLKVTAVAADHSMEGLVEEVERAVTAGR